MSTIFIKECDYVLEANVFLLRHFTGETMSYLHEHMKKKAGYSDETRATFQTLEKVYDEISEKVKIPETLRMYFQGFDAFDDFHCSLADCMLHQGISEKGISYEDLTEYIKMKFHENGHIFMNDVLSREDDKIFSEDEFMNELSKLQIDDGVKWNIWNVYKHFDEHVDILMPTILQIIPIMKEVYKKYDDEFKVFYDFWETTCKEDTLDEKLNSVLNLEFKSTHSIIVRPTWMGCNSIRVHSESNDMNNLQLKIGVLFHTSNVLNDTVFSKEEVCARLKLLSDTSKYEILKLIKNDKLYGAQLADELHLTTATISHHISSLTSKGLISIEKDANRIYYRLNKVQMGIVIDQLRKDLYED